MLKLDGVPLSVREADATLFAGRLDVDIETDDEPVCLANVPMGDILDFKGLHSYHISIKDCRDYSYEDSSPRPWLCRGSPYRDIKSLDVSINARGDGLLTIELDVTTFELDEIQSQTLRGVILATCSPTTYTQIVYPQGPIPIRFAEHYLPILGLPPLPSNATEQHVISALGCPDHSGGGTSSKSGYLPKWVRYTLPGFYLHFQFEHDFVTAFTTMLLSDPPCDLVQQWG